MLLALLLVLPPTGETSRVLVDASGSLGFTTYSSTNRNVFIDAHAFEADAGLDAVIYLGRPVVDDDSPISLQAFLQRRSGIEVFANGTQFTLTETANHRDVSAGSVGLDVFGYPRRRLYLFGEFKADGSIWQDTSVVTGTMPHQSELTLLFRAGGGLRLDDVLVDLSWGVTPGSLNDAAFIVPYWYDLRLRVRAVIAGSERLDASLEALNQGAGFGIDYEHFFDRDIGLSLSFAAGGAKYVVPPASYFFVNPSAGLFVWLTSRWQLHVSYSPTFTTAGAPISQSRWQHLFTLGFAARL